MRIVREKNLAFSDQPKPLASAEISSHIKDRKAKKALENAEVEQLLFLPSAEQKVSSHVEKLEQGHAVRVKISNMELGRHAIPPSVPTKAIKTLGNKSDKFRSPLHSEGLIPEHLGLRVEPERLAKEFDRPRFLAAPGIPSQAKRGFQATTIFPPDNRYVFNDTHYPWCTCGRVDSALGQGSGVMVGPRHLLTVSHVIQWNGDGTAGWVRFSPSYFDGSKPFGDAWAVRTYYKDKVSGPTIDF